MTFAKNASSDSNKLIDVFGCEGFELQRKSIALPNVAKIVRLRLSFFVSTPAPRSQGMLSTLDLYTLRSLLYRRSPCV